MKPVPCSHCGNMTNQPKGLCVICSIKEETKDEERSGPGRKPGGDMTNKPRCIAEGCAKGQWREQMCMVHYKQKHGILPKKRGKKQAEKKPAGDSNNGNIRLRLIEAKNELHNEILAIDTALEMLGKYAKEGK